MKIAFIGLGIMGSRMASHLADNNVDLTVYNRTREAAGPLQEKGAKVAETAAEAVRNADMVFSMLSTPEVVADVFFGAGKVLQSMKKNALWVDCTTVNPSFSLQAKEEAEKAGIRFRCIAFFSRYGRRWRERSGALLSDDGKENLLYGQTRTRCRV